MKVSLEDQGETLVVTAASRASTRQYQVPFPNFTDQLVPDIQLDADLIEEK